MFATILTLKSNNLNKEYKGAFYLLADLTPRELKEDRLMLEGQQTRSSMLP